MPHKELPLAERQLLIRQLMRKLGETNHETIDSIDQLTLEQLESLGDALLDFNAIRRSAFMAK